HPDLAARLQTSPGIRYRSRRRCSPESACLLSTCLFFSSSAAGSASLAPALARCWTCFALLVSNQQRPSCEYKVLFRSESIEPNVARLLPLVSARNLGPSS